MSIRTTLSAVIMTFFFSVSMTGNAEEWQADEVTDLTARIVDSLENIAEQAGDPGAQPEAFQEKNYNSALIQLKQLIVDMKKLQGMLVEGRTMQQTFPRYRQLTDLRASIRYYADNTEIDESLQQQADEIRAMFLQLDAYYE